MRFPILLALLLVTSASPVFAEPAPAAQNPAEEKTAPVASPAPRASVSFAPDAPSVPSEPPKLDASTLSRSPFFSATEMESIETALDRKDRQTRQQKKLDAILYFDATHWKVWYGGESYTPQTRRRDIHVLKVAPQSVRFAFFRHGERTEVTLHLNESAEGSFRKAPKDEKFSRPASEE